MKSILLPLAMCIATSLHSQHIQKTPLKEIEAKPCVEHKVLQPKAEKYTAKKEPLKEKVAPAKQSEIQKEPKSFTKAAKELKMVAPSHCSPSPDPVLIQQPDGSMIAVVAKGNIGQSWVESTDGYALAKNNNGVYEYATKINGNLLAAGVKANDVGSRSTTEINYITGLTKSLSPNISPLKTSILNQVRQQIQHKSFPTTGSINICALLIDYPNLTSTYSKANFDSLMSGLNYRNGDGSFKVFFETASHGLLTINVDVYGWYRATNNYTYYGNSNGSGRAADLVREAVNAAEAAGVNFAPYDNDNDGDVDGILAVHSGPGAEQGAQNQYIWSHRWVLNGGTLGAVTYDGKFINDYMINPETRFAGASQNIVGIGVICHEFGHNLGLPDLYDTDPSNGDSEGIGEWGLMAGGGWLGGEHLPGNFCAWAKVENNWDTPVNLTIGNSSSHTMSPASLNQNEIYRVNTTVNNEYFLIENRQKVGLDIALPSEGLAIWHINTSKTNAPGNGVNADETLKGVDLEEADGNNDLDNEVNRGDAGDLFPGSSVNRTFDDNSNPNAKTYNNSNTGLQIRNITESGNTVSFDFGPPVIGLAPGDTMYYQDFANSIPAGWTSVSNSGVSGHKWIWSNSAPGGQFSTNAGALNSSTTSNGYLSMPADLYNTPQPAGGYRTMDTYVQSNAISIQPRPSVLVRYQHYLRWCCNNTNELVLEVSTNGTSWTPFSGRGTGTTNIGTPNAEIVEVDISSIAANQSTIYVRFRMTGNTHYFWMIDDLAIVNGYDNALILEGYQVNFSTQYTYNPFFTQIPKNVFEPVSFSGQIRNAGSSNETGVQLRAQVLNNINPTPVYNQTEALGSTMPPQQVNVLTVSNPDFNANYNANFTADISVESNAVNQRPNLSTATYDFELTDSVFARDRGVFAGGVGPGSYSGGGFNGDELATMFTMGQSGGIVTSASYYISNSNNNIGATFRPTLYHWNDDSAAVGAGYGGTLTKLSSNTQLTYTATSADLDSWVTIRFNAPITTQGGNQYLLGFEQIGSTELLVGRDLSVQTHIPDVTNFVQLSTGWGWISAQGGMRMNMGNVIATVSDASITSVASPSEEYTIIPSGHHRLFTQSAWVKNEGSANLNNVRVVYDVFLNGSIYASDSTPSINTLVVGDSVQLFSNSNFNYITPGDYYVSYEVKFNGTDANTFDNFMVSDTMTVSDSIFARDNGTATGSLGIGPGTPGELGSIFETQTNDSLTSIRVFINNTNGGMTGQPLSANVRSFNGTPGAIIATTDTIIYSSTGASYVNLTFNNAGGYVPLGIDTFFVGVVEGDSNVTIGTTPEIFKLRTTWVDFPGNPQGGWANNEDFNFFVTYLINPVFGAINVNCNAPMANFSYPVGNKCEGTSLTFSNLSTGTNANTVYSWDVNNDGTIESNNTDYTHQYNQAGTYTVTLIARNNSCADTASLSIVINPSPTADAGMNQSICNGGSVQIGGSPTGPSGSTYAWNNSTTLSSSNSANPTASPTVTTTYTVTVTNTQSCSSTDQVTVTVVPTPTADAGSNTNICSGSSTQIGGSPTGPSGATYTWDNAATLSSASSANPVASPTVTTTYTVTVSVSPSCTSTDQITVVVNPNPTADAGNNQTICNGGSTSIGGAPTGPAGSTYSWDNSSTLNSSSNQNPVATPTTTTVYTVTVTDVNGCTSTDQVTVTVNQNPTVDAGTNQTICDGNSIMIGGSPTSTTSGATYSWDNASTLNNANVANPTASPQINTTYSVTVTHPNGCTATDQVTITVNPNPTADAGVNQTICSGNTISIGGAPTSSTAGASYAWDNSATLNSSTIANPSASPNVTTTYTVTVTHPNGCTATDQVTVNVNPSPTADAGSNQAICDGGSIQIGGSPTGPTGANYSWDNSATLSSSISPNPTASPTNTTTYTVTVTASNGCTSTDQVTVTVNSLDTTVTQNNATLTASQSGANYQWLQCGSGGIYTPISGETSQSFTATTNGNYALSISSGACSDTTQCYAVITIGLENLAKMNYELYPNPAKDVLQLNFANSALNRQLTIRNIAGQEVFHSSVNENNNTIHLNVASGIYFVTISNGENTIVEKLIVK